MAQKKSFIGLQHYLWRSGPFIIFYNSRCSGYNQELVKYMNFMAAKYPALQIFEIDWEEKKFYNAGTIDEDMNTVYIHSRSAIKAAEFCPDRNKINELFKKAICYYNKNLENRAMNIGSRGKRFNNNLPKLSLQPPNESEKKKLESRRKSILKKRITYRRDSFLSSEENEKCKISKNNRKAELLNQINKNDVFTRNDSKENEKTDFYSFEHNHHVIKNFEEPVFCLPNKIQRQRENLKRISGLSNSEFNSELRKNNEYKCNSYIENQNIQNKYGLF